MIQTKLFEVRDAGTFIPCVGILCQVEAYLHQLPSEHFLLRKSGYGDKSCVLFGKLNAPSHLHSDFSYDVYGHVGQARTIKEAHKYVEEHWYSLHSGDVIDVEFILGESKTQKVSELHG